MATGCGDFADDPEKKFDIFALSEGELDGGGGADASAVTAGVGPPSPLLAEQPGASNARDSKAATDARSRHLI